ncbi:hypothetical protein PRUPE_8G030500 [Prunus persica]|uniref:Uncharacterized protein n=1 Tax=Prunus persica TaxID=3760 RepID=A0A251MS28_PRUPE|nr:hypothetical protein PRUPE_8G030500 [Prunus persica]
MSSWHLLGRQAIDASLYLIYACCLLDYFQKDISNISPLQSFLVDVALAKPLRTDSWHCLIRMKRTQSSTGKPYAFCMDPLPHCLHEVGDVEKADNPTFYGRFCYYFILRGKEFHPCLYFNFFSSLCAQIHSNFFYTPVIISFPYFLCIN